MPTELWERQRFMRPTEEVSSSAFDTTSDSGARLNSNIYSNMCYTSTPRRECGGQEEEGTPNARKTCSATAVNAKCSPESATK